MFYNQSGKELRLMGHDVLWTFMSIGIEQFYG